MLSVRKSNRKRKPSTVLATLPTAKSGAAARKRATVSYPRDHVVRVTSQSGATLPPLPPVASSSTATSTAMSSWSLPIVSPLTQASTTSSVPDSSPMIQFGQLDMVNASQPQITGTTQQEIGNSTTTDQDLLPRLWDKGYTPVLVERLLGLLKDYPARYDAKVLMDGFLNGFCLDYNGPCLLVKSKKLLSAEQQQLETLEKINQEVKIGRILGPFSRIPISNLRISPIGLFSKPDGGWRLITNLSYPESNSVNSYIDQQFCKVSYSSLDKILEKIYDLGYRANLAKIDIKSAFRLLPINPADFDLLGIKFCNGYYIDKCLPMGCSISCNLFEKFSTFLHWMVEIRSGLHTLDHYLDDFIFMGGEHTQECSLLMSTFMELCEELGVPIADNKTVWLTTILPFLGYIIDTELMVVLIPKEKTEKLKNMLMSLLPRKKITRRELESIVGLMSFCSRAIPSLRAFLRRFYDLISSVKKTTYRIRLNSEFKSDVKIWLLFLELFNGQCFFPDRIWISNETIHLFTDSSGNPDLGCGVYYNGRWAQCRWPTCWRNLSLLKNLSLLELVPIVMAMFLWVEEFTNKKILFHTDNSALVSIINKRTSKDKLIMELIRPFVFLTMLHNVQFKAIHIEGAKNEIADSLSRFQMKRFRRLAPTADQNPAPVPGEFWTIILGL